MLAELVGKLKEKLDPKKLAATSAGEKPKRGELRPNLDRLTVGVDLGDKWSNYCILGLEGETLAEGQLRRRRGFPNCSRHWCRSSGLRGGDTFPVGAEVVGGGARGAGGQSADNGGAETSQAEE